MAAGDATELALSRDYDEQGVDFGRIVRRYRVESTHPDAAIQIASPPFPKRGSRLGRIPGWNQEHWESMRLVGRRATHFPGSIKDSLVILTYATALASVDDGGFFRKVVWEMETSLVSETILFDLDANPIPGGVQREVSIRTDRAILNGITNARRLYVTATLVGKVNIDHFEPMGWFPRTARFVGMRMVPMAGTGGISHIKEPLRAELTFQVKLPDWRHRTIKLDENTGLPVMGSDGKIQVNEHRIYEEVSFSGIFPSTWAA